MHGAGYSIRPHALTIVVNEVREARCLIADLGVDDSFDSRLALLEQVVCSRLVHMYAIATAELIDACRCSSAGCDESDIIALEPIGLARVAEEHGG